MKYIIYSLLIFCISCSTTELGSLPKNDYYNIENNSSTRYADRVLAYCLNELNIENMEFIIINIKNNNYYRNVPKGINGILRKNDDNYEISLRSGLKDNEIVRVLCHESYHIFQFQNGSLIILTEEILEFNHVSYDIREISYLQRPWELQAIVNTIEITKNIKYKDDRN